MCNPLFERPGKNEKEFEPEFPGDSRGFRKQELKKWSRGESSWYDSGDGNP